MRQGAKEELVRRKSPERRFGHVGRNDDTLWVTEGGGGQTRALTMSTEAGRNAEPTRAECCRGFFGIETASRNLPPTAESGERFSASESSQFH